MSEDDIKCHDIPMTSHGIFLSGTFWNFKSPHFPDKSFDLPKEKQKQLQLQRRRRTVQELLLSYIIFLTLPIIIAYPIFYAISPNLAILLISFFDHENRNFIIYFLCLFVEVVMHAQLLLVIVLLTYFLLSFIITVQGNTETQLRLLRQG